MNRRQDIKVKKILRQAKKLSCEYYALTKKPLSITGEVAEYEAAQKLKLKLTTARNKGFDATKRVRGKLVHFQIKGRAASPSKKYVGRISRISRNGKFDQVLLVLLDNSNLNVIEILQSSRRKVLNRLEKKGSKARNQRGQLAISQFKSIATCVWPKRL
jgi:Family of unknown function (DUF6998)